MKTFIVKTLLVAVLFTNASSFLVQKAQAQEQGAKVWISPSNETHNVDEVFTLSLYVTSLHRSLNVIEGELQFSNKNIELVRVSKEGSIFSFWVGEPFYSNETGIITFRGGLQSPGFVGAQGKILDVSFKAIAKGPANINWTGGSVLANDGKATDILTGKEDSSITINAQVAGVPLQAPSTNPLPTYIILALVVVLIPVSALFFRRRIRSRSRVDKDKIAAKTIVEEKFNTMRKDFSEELWRLEKKLKKGEPFSKEEMDRREKLLRELGEDAAEIEGRVEKI